MAWRENLSTENIESVVLFSPVKVGDFHSAKNANSVDTARGIDIEIFTTH